MEQSFLLKPAGRISGVPSRLISRCTCCSSIATNRTSHLSSLDNTISVEMLPSSCVRKSSSADNRTISPISLSHSLIFSIESPASFFQDTCANRPLCRLGHGKFRPRFEQSGKYPFVIIRMPVRNGSLGLRSISVTFQAHDRRGNFGRERRRDMRSQFRRKPPQRPFTGPTRSLPLTVWATVASLGLLTPATLLSAGMFMEQHARPLFDFRIIIIISITFLFTVDIILIFLFWRLSGFFAWLVVATAELTDHRGPTAPGRPKLGILGCVPEVRRLTAVLQRRRRTAEARHVYGYLVAIAGPESLDNLNAPANVPFRSGTADARPATGPRWAQEISHPLAAVTNYVAATRQHLLSRRWDSPAIEYLDAAIEQLGRAAEILTRMRKANPFDA